MGVSRFCASCGLEAEIPALSWIVDLRPCTNCGKTKFVEEKNLKWDVAVCNEYDLNFLRVNRISPK